LTNELQARPPGRKQKSPSITTPKKSAVLAVKQV